MAGPPAARPRPRRAAARPARRGCAARSRLSWERGVGQLALAAVAGRDVGGDAGRPRAGPRRARTRPRRRRRWISTTCVTVSPASARRRPSSTAGSVAVDLAHRAADHLAAARARARASAAALGEREHAVRVEREQHHRGRVDDRAQLGTRTSASAALVLRSSVTSISTPCENSTFPSAVADDRSPVPDLEHASRRTRSAGTRGRPRPRRACSARSSATTQSRSSGWTTVSRRSRGPRSTALRRVAGPALDLRADVADRRAPRRRRRCR